MVWTQQGLIVAIAIFLPVCINLIIVHALKAQYPDPEATPEMLVIHICSCLLSVPLEVIISIGMIHTALKQINEESIKLSNIFIGYRYLGGSYLILLIDLLFFIAYYVIVFFERSAMPSTPAQMQMVSLITMLAYYLVQFFFSAFLFLTIPIFVSQRVSAGRSIVLSWQTASTAFGLFFFFSLTMSLLSMAGLIACCIGVIATIPFLSIAKAVAYTHSFPTGPNTAPTVTSGAIPPPYYPASSEQE